MYHCLAQMFVAVNDEHMSAKAAVASSLLMGASLSDSLLDGRQWSQTLPNLMNNNDDPTVSLLLTSSYQKHSRSFKATCQIISQKSN